MIALISPAKTMRSGSEIKIEKGESTQPRFMEQTNYLVSQMLQYSSKELEEMFKVSTPIARELRQRFAHFVEDTDQSVVAVASYDGVVYKHFKPQKEFSKAQKQYLQTNLRISSLLYGLLRPFDTIKPYRMEGFIRIEENGERVDKFWRKHQTQTLIDDVNNAGGTLLYLASKEEQNAFDWKEVKKQVRVIDFQFLQYKGDKLRQVVIYTKMARGNMIKYMLDNSINNPEDLKNFEWGGYVYNDTLSTQDVWVWVMD